MLLGIKYEDVEKAFGGNIDPSKDRAEETQRVYNAFEMLIQQYHRGVLHVSDMPPIKEGRRYWVAIRIDDPTNPVSQVMTHSIESTKLEESLTLTLNTENSNRSRIGSGTREGDRPS